MKSGSTDKATIDCIGDEVTITFKSNVMIDGEAMWQIKEVIWELLDKKRHRTLIKADGFPHFTKDAREVSASAEYTKDVIAAVFVTDLLPYRLLGNFFIKMNKPPIPMKIFSEVAEAQKWLAKF